MKINMCVCGSGPHRMASGEVCLLQVQDTVGSNTAELSDVLSSGVQYRVGKKGRIESRASEYQGECDEA